MEREELSDSIFVETDYEIFIENKNRIANKRAKKKKDKEKWNRGSYRRRNLYYDDEEY